MSATTDSQTRIVLDHTPAKVTVVRTPCMCGCGDFPVRDKARFIPGHDAKLESMLITAHLDGVKELAIRTGPAETDVRVTTPMAFAEELDWEAFLATAARVRDRKVAEKEAAKKK